MAQKAASRKFLSPRQSSTNRKQVKEKKESGTNSVKKVQVARKKSLGIDVRSFKPWTIEVSSVNDTDSEKENIDSRLNFGNYSYRSFDCYCHRSFVC